MLPLLSWLKLRDRVVIVLRKECWQHRRKVFQFVIPVRAVKKAAGLF